MVIKKLQPKKAGDKSHFFSKFVKTFTGKNSSRIIYIY